MQRDLDLIRELLLRVEQRPGPPFEFDVEGASRQDVNYQLALLVDERFLDGKVLRAGTVEPGETGVYDVHVRGLTWHGHDLLDAIRDEGVWSAVKEKISSTVGSTSLAVVKTLAIEYAKGRLGLDG